MYFNYQKWTLKAKSFKILSFSPRIFDRSLLAWNPENLKFKMALKIMAWKLNKFFSRSELSPECDPFLMRNVHVVNIVVARCHKKCVILLIRVWKIRKLLPYTSWAVKVRTKSVGRLHCIECKFSKTAKISSSHAHS